MRILEKPKTINNNKNNSIKSFIQTCSNCKCKFSFNDNETRIVAVKDWYGETGAYRKGINCPCCNSFIVIDENFKY